MRHLDTGFLWIQSKVLDKKITLHKVGTKENIADVFTKFPDGCFSALADRVCWYVDTNQFFAGA